MLCSRHVGARVVKQLGGHSTNLQHTHALFSRTISSSHAYLAPPRCHTVAVGALPARQACLHTAALVDPLLLLLHLRASWGTWLQAVTGLKGQPMPVEAALHPVCCPSRRKLMPQYCCMLALGCLWAAGASRRYQLCAQLQEISLQNVAVGSHCAAGNFGGDCCF